MKKWAFLLVGFVIGHALPKISPPKLHHGRISNIIRCDSKGSHLTYLDEKELKEVWMNYPSIFINLSKDESPYFTYDYYEEFPFWFNKKLHIREHNYGYSL